MPVASRAEFYFIAAMMFLILVLCTAAVYLFFKTYKKEMREKQERIEREKAAREQAVNGHEQDHSV
jgi:Na+/H+ antiporter NhaD/arsenite permease-like protein